MHAQRKRFLGVIINHNAHCGGLLEKHLMVEGKKKKKIVSWCEAYLNVKIFVFALE